MHRQFSDNNNSAPFMAYLYAVRYSMCRYKASQYGIVLKVEWHALRFNRLLVITQEVNRRFSFKGWVDLLDPINLWKILKPLYALLHSYTATLFFKSSKFLASNLVIYSMVWQHCYSDSGCLRSPRADYSYKHTGKILFKGTYMSIKNDSRVDIYTYVL